MAEATRIYIHSTAREEQKRKAITAAGHMRHTTVHELVFPLEPFPKSVTTIGVVGGDGSARAVGRKILEEESDRTLLVFPGGSENGFYNCLVAENTVLRADDLLANDYENVPFFHPGERNGEFFFPYRRNGDCHRKTQGI